MECIRPEKSIYGTHLRTRLVSWGVAHLAYRYRTSLVDLGCSGTIVAVCSDHMGLAPFGLIHVVSREGEVSKVLYFLPCLEDRGRALGRRLLGVLVLTFFLLLTDGKLSSTPKGTVETHQLILLFVRYVRHVLCLT